MTRRKAPRAPLTEREWEKVFVARCRGKRGERLHDDEQELVDAAFREDRKRYAAMEPRVFNATVPFGSHVRRKEE